MPTQDRIGCGDRGHLGQQLAAQPLAQNCQSAPISVREIQFPVAKLFCSGNGNIEPSGSACFLLTE